MSTNIPPAPVPQPPVQNGDSSIRLAEYASLRDDILKQVEIQNQLLTLTIVFAGTVFTVAFSQQSLTLATVMLFIYPFVIMAFTAGWVNSSYKINKINKYIRTKLNNHLHDLGWEEYVYNLHANGKSGSFTLLYVFGIFGGTQLLAILIGLSSNIATTRLLLLGDISSGFGIDLLQRGISMSIGLASFGFTIYLLIYARKHAWNF